jgi:formylglycine-generating enzyme
VSGCQHIAGLPDDVVLAACASGQSRCDGLKPQECDATGTWRDVGVPCSAGAWCSSGLCVMPTSCQASGAGLSSCGPNGDESCCASPVVAGGTYNRSNIPSYPATMSDFRLDRFEITVGRFRQFVAGYPGNKPAAGAGAHPLIPGSGWDSTLNDVNLPADQAALKSVVKCPQFPTWTDMANGNEDLPMNCINWWVAFAFCAWDGGRLPTEAEWNYAAAAGSEQRQYPWGNAAPDATFAVYDCTGDGSAAQDCAFTDILKVGSRSPNGDGKWGQADLAGSVYEWNLDWWNLDLKTSYLVPCNDCANLTTTQFGVIRGGGWFWGVLDLASSFRNADGHGVNDRVLGARCARNP